MKRLLILGAYYFQIPVVEKAKEMGLYVGIADINPEAPAFAYADEHFVGSIRDKEAMLAVANAFHPDAIMSGVGDLSVTTVAYLCKQFGLPGHSEETALKATDKLEMLKAFEAHQVAHPRFQLIRKNEIENAKIDIPCPIISKPTDSAGSRGVRYIEKFSGGGGGYCRYS